MTMEIEMLGLTLLGSVHTAISLVALAAGIVALVREHAISPDTAGGRVYIWTTVATCITGFGIFEHGGFGKPHALGVMTLLVLGLVWLARSRPVFGRGAPYVETIGLSLTFFFHLVPGLTETFTRLPVGSPLFSSPEDPGLQKAVAVAFLLFLVGAALQVKKLRARLSPARRAKLV
jgi:uncharacterized membrane protein